MSAFPWRVKRTFPDSFVTNKEKLCPKRQWGSKDFEWNLRFKSEFEPVKLIVHYKNFFFNIVNEIVEKKEVFSRLIKCYLAINSL